MRWVNHLCTAYKGEIPSLRSQYSRVQVGGPFPRPLDARILKRTDFPVPLHHIRIILGPPCTYDFQGFIVLTGQREKTLVKKRALSFRPKNDTEQPVWRDLISRSNAFNFTNAKNSNVLIGP